MGLVICDIAADARSTWQFVFDIDQRISKEPRQF
jgi:hypothetical protein